MGTADITLYAQWQPDTGILPEQPDAYSVTLTKTDADDSSLLLSDAKFDLYKENGAKVGGYTTGASGKIIVSGLADGSYYFVETAAPVGYKLDTGKQSFTISGKDTAISVTNAKGSSANPDDTPIDLNSKEHIKYVIGYPDGSVQPNGDITRAEVATMFYRLLTETRRAQIFTASNGFTDVDGGYWYGKAVSSMANGGYILGYPDGTFGGNNAITRAEAITIINRMLKRGVAADGVMDGCKVWPDNQPEAWYYYEIIEAANDHAYTGARPNERWTSLTIDFFYDINKYERP